MKQSLNNGLQSTETVALGWARTAAIFFGAGLLSAVTASSALAQVEAAEVYCSIRETGTHLNCQWVGKDARRSMTPEETAQFIDKAEIAAYISVRSRRGMERTYLVDADAIQFKKLDELKRTGSISEIARAKLELFSEIEKKAIKISDDLDAQNATMELVKYDSSIVTDKYKRELRRMDQELVTLKADLDQKSSPSKIYENNPEKVDSGSNSSTYAYIAAQGAGMFASNVELMIGVGGSNNTAAIGGGSGGIGTTQGYGDFAVRYSINPNWYLSAETQYGFTGSYTGANGFNSGSLSPVTNLVAAHYCIAGQYCIGLEFAPGTSYVGYQYSPNQQMALWTENFVGGSFSILYKVGGWLMIPRLAYWTGTNATTISAGTGQGGTTTGSSDSRFLFTYNAEKTLAAHHGIVAQLFYQSTSATLTTNTTNAINPAVSNYASLADSEGGLNVYYKYAF